ncbi:putative inactive pancreatic lipase-related protein 1 [Apostichopus japonicus]|uniref:Putative inactive pancreatic lipase-related protein 1 n=1 Tax=Stichopus japonicus TaxID=307972 RepID=A0A2G8L642_STIJA|nr:putative inactive pancreatic lipase-related protein 1 [Apostichopus japonicus]
MMMTSCSAEDFVSLLGLDPAGPHFDQFTHLDCKLDPTDAPFVDVIHTDAFLGSAQTHGHLDFFPNGGSDQPGCWKALLGRDVCDHLRSIWYFTESFDTSECEFKSYPCSSWDDFENGHCNSCGDNSCPIMGYHAKDGAPGVYMLETNGDQPYCVPEEEEEDDGWWFW